MRTTTLLTVGAFLLASGFIIKKGNKNSNGLFENKWTLQKIHGDNEVKSVSNGAYILLHEFKKSAGGNGSCNVFGTTLHVSGNRIAFTGIFSTRMFCDDVQDTEDSFLKQLGRVNRYQLKDKILLLYRDKKLLLEFEII